jgi:hypothetical protein|tara:strand:- start:4862 stop:6643 length:1782 start_codon:yes stop_codon:yes gene_type:complete
MVDFYVPEQQFDKNAFDSYFDISKAGTLDVLGATLDETLYYNPLSALNRTFDQYLGPGADGRRLSAEEYRDSQYYRPGIEVDEDGITEGLANLFAERHDRRAAFRSTLNRSRGGFGLGAAQFGTMLAGSVIDPLNIASAFIPTVGAARMATMAAKYGKTGSRLVGGAINGTVGAVAVEPLVVGQAFLEQDTDYGLMDSFLNVTFGAVLGGGLHAGFGKISDRIEASSVKREALARAIVDAVNDQEVQAGKIIEVEEAAKDADIIAAANDRLAKDRSVRGVERRFDPKTGDIVEETVIREDDVTTLGEPAKRKGKARPPRLRAKEPKTLIQFIRANGGIDPESQGAADLKEVIPAAKAGKFYVSAAKGGKSVDDMLTAAREEGYLPPEIEGQADDIGINDLIDAVREDKTGNKQYSAADAEAVAQFDDAQRIADFLDRKGIDPTGMTDEQLDRAIVEAEFVDEQLSMPSVDRNVEPSSLEGAPLTQQESLNAQNEAQAQDYDLGVDIDGKPKLVELDESGMDLRVREYQDTVDEIAQLEEELTVARADSEDELPQDFIDDIESADAAIRRADEYMPEAVKRAAVCVFGKSGAAS